MISVVYLDDVFCIGRTLLECQENITLTKTLFERLGFLINLEKSSLVPKMQCKFLGFVFDSNNMLLKLPDDKKLKIKEKVSTVLNTKKCKLREFAQFIGLLISACPAIQYAWLYTKIFEQYKYMCLLKNASYEQIIKIPDNLKSDMLWWIRNIDIGNCPLGIEDFNLEIYSDASNTGWGAYCNNNKCFGYWRECEKTLHINELELKAAFLALKSFAKNLCSSRILLRIDNVTAISCINRMGSIQYDHLNVVTREIWQWCEMRKITIFASYINTKDNCEADQLSRKKFHDTEWELNQNAYDEITINFGVPKIDLFASRCNAKCHTYVTWKNDPDAWAIDAFTVSWKNKFFYAFPPFCLITKDQPQPTQNSEVGCREAFRQALLRKGLSPSTVQIMLSSLSDSTYKQYDGCIKTWINYCSTHNYSYISASVPVVLHFLTDLFNKGAKYGTINSYKSALSLILSNLEDDRVKRFMKGVFKSRPTNPKYHITWDPSIVLEHLAQQWPNNELSLETLSKKTATLLALVTAHRVQTLALIKLKDLDIRGTSEIIIMISDLIKTSKPYSLQPLLRIPYFNSRSEICPAKCLESYVNKTSTLRHNDHLFISFKKPYSKVTSQTLSKWIKDTLHNSGVDTSIFSAHSTRHASTSTANRLGVNIDVIRKTAGWSDSSAVFAKFYNRHVITDPTSFAKTLLSNNDCNLQEK
ncbi:uncharacterized protein LOC123695740 isoform X1 [Colias croceus]|uniref:uncharacterized protein LOC123695740 isoform X1 n=2 Tax=Colias crocea TaxID=72248 RepID=UPI001E27DDEC|nr:uncharacterized protein LOC123695740 isoform X1 [Colias croceus]